MSESPRFNRHDLSVTIPMASSECRRLYQDLAVSWQVVSDDPAECRLRASSRRSFDAGQRSWEKVAPTAPRSSARRVDLCITKDGALVLDDGESYRVGHFLEEPKLKVGRFEAYAREELQVLASADRAGATSGGFTDEVRDEARKKHRTVVERLGRVLAVDALWPTVASLGNGRVACQVRVESGPPRSCPPLQTLPFHLVPGIGEKSIGLSHALAVAPLRNLGDSGEESRDWSGEPTGSGLWVVSPGDSGDSWERGRVSIQEALMSHELNVASSPDEASQAVFLYHGPNELGRLRLDQTELQIADLIGSVVKRRKAPLEVVFLNSCDSNSIDDRNRGPLDLLDHARIVVATLGKLPPFPSELCAYHMLVARFLADYMGGRATAGEAMLAARIQDAQSGSLAWQHYCLYGDVDTTWGGNPRLTNQ